MAKDIELSLSPEEAAHLEQVKAKAAKALRVRRDEVTGLRFIRRSIDSRRSEVRIRCLARAYLDGEAMEDLPVTCFQIGDESKPVIIVGAGPAGLFAALKCLELGMKPIILERGKDSHERKKDIARLYREGLVDPDSNYAFGLGGAGAFSDGKLYTRSVKRGDVGHVLSLLVQHGASSDILVDAQPHIGSDKLPAILEAITDTIRAHGGEVHYSTKVTGLVREGESVIGADSTGGIFMGPVILATGHSAKDVYHFLDEEGFVLEAKDTAIGVRLEHPQDLIDRMQYHSPAGRGPWLPAASYRFVTQVGGRGVYSFCMCPGGIIVPTVTEEGSLSVNGMSPSSRALPRANSGMVVQLRKDDVDDGDDAFAMLRYVEAVERMCHGRGLVAPAQRMTDFLAHKPSSSLPRSSYIPGLEAREMDEVLPALVASSLREGLSAFVDMTRGRFLCKDALLIAPETRTSSPVKVPRNDELWQCPGFYPCGEGAGHAGGIVSAALDGIATAQSVFVAYACNKIL